MINERDYNYALQQIVQYTNALEKAIKKLREYAANDEVAGLNGSGCYNNPFATVEEWIKEIMKEVK